VSTTDATGIGVTVTVAVPLRPPLDAVMVADPTLTPVTTPLVDTAAAAGSLLVQDTDDPDIGFPAWSRTVAVIWAVCPTWTLVLPGVTLTLATVGPDDPPGPEPAPGPAGEPHPKPVATIIRRPSIPAAG